ncbi:MAG: 16S rRNA (cytosine(1402)-N(4))-methyltransferase [Gammaproteobacteria bacterium]|nr:MAG: 16S rRNA (cytosine(1402)-N(4))-methyltransferase [Gammaproteobacteria bacterium]
MHISVLCDEAIDELKIVKDGFYIDATFGRGGHSKEILKRLGSGGKLFAFDQDTVAVEEGKKIKDDRFFIKHMNFVDLQKWCLENNLNGKIDGILFDLGLSSPQLDDKNRGFSFLKNGKLDMRMNPKQKYSAYQWLQTTDEKKIVWVLKEYGEERFATRIAKNIIKSRQKKDIKTTYDLVNIIQEATPFLPKNKHPATRTFQAIRIAINKELDVLKAALQSTLSFLKKDGRLTVISFHSLEDRIVKKFLKQTVGNRTNNSIIRYLPIEHRLNFKNIKRVKPDEKETRNNPRSRSAILRSGTKI